MAGLGMAFEVVDEKLAAGRGADFSAAKIVSNFFLALLADLCQS